MEHLPTASLAEAHHNGLLIAQHHGRRFAGYLRDLSEDEVSLVVPGLTWTVGDTATHVESVVSRYVGDPRRSDTPEGVSVQNQDDVERLGVDVRRSAEAIEASLAAMTGITDAVDPERTFPFHGGQQVTLAQGWGNLIAEFFIHGDDIGRAVGRPFEVPGADLEIMLRHCLPVLSGWLTEEAADLDETWSIEAPFGHVHVSIVGGTIAATVLELDCDASPSPSAHRVVTNDVADLLLQMPYGRRPARTEAIALLASRFVDL